MVSQGVGRGSEGFREFQWGPEGFRGLRGFRVKWFWMNVDFYEDCFDEKCF